MTIYAIGDIHWQADLLLQAHARIAADKARHGADDARVVHLGDYCDRGPHTARVLDFLCEGLDAGAPWICLLGNHDRMMRRFLEPGQLTDPLHDTLHWMGWNIGGEETMASYGVTPDRSLPDARLHAALRAAVPARHRQFLDDLDPFYRSEDAFFCHAGVLPGRALDAQDEDDLIWIREPFLSDITDHGALIVHGHTPVPEPMHYGNRLNLDSGAAFGGSVSAAVIEGRDAWLLTGQGRKRLKPLLAA